MAARAVMLIGDTRNLLAGLSAVALGLLAFPVLVLSSVIDGAASGTWLPLPPLLLVLGVGQVMGWLVLREGALPTYDAEPVAAWWLDR